MENFLTKILGDKKEWKRMEARAEALAWLETPR